MKYNDLTREEKENWICERIETSQTGRVIIKKPLVDKWRKLVDDQTSSDSIIRNSMIMYFQDYI